MTPAEFRNYAELAGWAVIGLYLLAKLVRGDREISVRIGGSKRRIKLGELAERVEKCETRTLTGSSPFATKDTVQANEEGNEKAHDDHEAKLQALDERHDHLAIAVSNARRRADEALSPAEYAEKMIDRLMPVIAYLAVQSGVTVKMEKRNDSLGTRAHRKYVLGLAKEFEDDLTDGEPTLVLSENHVPWGCDYDDDADPLSTTEFKPEEPPEVPDHASINSLDALVKVTRDELVALKRNLRLHRGAGDKHGLLSGNGMADLIDSLSAAVFADEMPKDAREFSRQFRNALRLAARTAGESTAEHIPEKPPKLDEVQWAKRALGDNGRHSNGNRNRTWGMCSLCGKVETVDGEVCDRCATKEIEKDAARCESASSTLGPLVRCEEARGHDGVHSNGHRAWQPRMCDHCGNVEVNIDGELCPACVEYEEKEAEMAATARTVIATATVRVTFDEAVKQATKPPAAVMAFWEQMRSDSALVTLFEKQGGRTLYTFGTPGAKVPMIGDPMLDEGGVVVGQVLDYNNNRDGDCFATCEAAEVFVAPVIRVIEPLDRDDYR